MGFLAAMTGLLSIYNGYNAYTLGLTKGPMAMFFLYHAMGGIAVFTFPVMLWIDRTVLTPMSDLQPSPKKSTEASSPASAAQIAAG